MLHRIEPACQAEFQWVQQLQADLIGYACRTAIGPGDITVANLLGLRADIDGQWLNKLLERKDKLSGSKRSMLAHLQTIAGAGNAKKTQLLSLVDGNRGFAEAFDDPSPSVHPLVPASSLNNDALEKAVRGFFTIFYDPEFYKQKGYPVPVADQARFTRDRFVSRFKETNEDLGVCPFCDGSLGDPDVDHFYAKKVYPDLATRADNLVPICKTCNGRNRKGEKAPLDDGSADPMRNWFHPYYRSAQGGCSVQFEERNGQTWPVLQGVDAQTDARLKNLDSLLGLTERWKSDLGHLVRSTVKQLKQRNRSSYMEKLAERAEDHEYEIRESSGAVLKQAYYACASGGQELLLEEIRIALEDLDPVTAD